MSEQLLSSRYLPWLLWLLLLALASWAYWPGLQGPSLLDDDKNLARIEILSDNPAFAADVIWGNRSGPLGRPVSMASFVVEKLYADAGLAGIKRSNLYLHLLIATLVFILFSRLFRYAQLPCPRWLPLLYAGLWLLSPLFVSTVLYSVQRMTQLSALGTVCAVLAYCEWRLAMLRGRRHWLWLVAVVAATLFAVFSKENGLLAPLLCLAVEWFWFGFALRDGRYALGVRRITGWLFVATAIAVALYLLFLGDWLMASYSARDFTASERMLTQSRVLWDYVCQLIWPAIDGMGIFHDDYPVSLTLFSPWSTAIAVISWLVLIYLMLRPNQHPQIRLLLCGLAIYLAGHILESTILPLELYFEHRNYLPGIGVYLALAALSGIVLSHYPGAAAAVLVPPLVALVIFAVQLGSQATVWSSRELIVLNAIQHHPGSLRTNVELAGLYAERGQLAKAWEYSRHADSLSASAADEPAVVRELVLACMANKPLPQGYLQRVSIGPQQAQNKALNNNFGTLVKMIQDQRCPAFDALALADRLQQLLLVPGSSAAATRNLWTLLAQLENYLQRYQPAYAYIQLLLDKSPGDIRGLFMQMYFAAALGKHQEKIDLFQQLQKLSDTGLLTLQDQHNLALFKP